MQPLGLLQFLPRNPAYSCRGQRREELTMQQIKWLVTVCLSPVAALVFAATICGVLVVSLTEEMHQHLWRPN